MIRYKRGILAQYVKPKVYKCKKELYDDNIFSFDIETSSAWYTPDNKLIAFDKSKDKKFYKQCIPFAVTYIWQFGVNNVVFYGRKLEDFKLLVEELKTLVVNPTIWVHNLSYEFQFLLNIFECEQVFARKPHKPIYAIMGGVKFRCSYMLTRLSLEAWGKKVGKEEKKTGQLDYSKLRTPYTMLTDEELEYCEHDILVMYFGLLEYMKKYSHIESIPLTQTGEVRKVVKDMYHNNMDYHRKMTNLVPRNDIEYTILKSAFAGGYTHANYIHANHIRSNVKSKDIASSYPFVMLSEKFPMSRWQAIRPYEVNKYRDGDHSLIVDITLYNVDAKTFNTYISVSKCYYKDKVVQDNGRVIKAKEVRLICTNIDLDIIEKVYKFTRMKFNRILMSVNEYLDIDYRKYILELYYNKTTLKDVDGMEDLYMQAKQFINSLYGMMVTDIVNDNADYDDGWIKTAGKINDILDDLRSKPYKNFLAYQHGVWVTAYARRNLWSIISQIDKDVVYVDTDSVKYIGNHEDVFEDYNRKAIEKLRVSISKYGIPMEVTAPINPKGKKCQIGIYEDEKPYKQFITLGAKRYAYTYYTEWDDKLKREVKQEDGKEQIHITVSGVNKKKGAKQLKSLKQFKNDLVFDYDHTGKLLMKYLDDMPRIVWNKGQYDEFYSPYKYGINAQPTTYSMSLSDEYLDLLYYLADEDKLDKIAE